MPGSIRTHRPHIFIVLSVALIVSCASLETFEDFDVDRDGLISKEEAMQSNRLGNMFQSADDNDDNQIDEEEFALAQKVMVGTKSSGPRPRADAGLRPVPQLSLFSVRIELKASEQESAKCPSGRDRVGSSRLE